MDLWGRRFPRGASNCSVRIDIMKLQWLFVVALLCMSLRSEAKTCYVDAAAGAGARNGTSWANAWTNMNGMTGLSAGDTVYISGGSSGSSKTYPYGAGNWLPASGSAGSRITYQIGQEAGHNGTAIFSGNNTLSWLSYSYVAPVHDIVISGNAGDGAQHFVLTNFTKMGTCDLYTNFYLGYVRAENLISGGIDGGQENIEFDHLYLYVTSSNVTCTSTLILTGTNYGSSSMHDCTFYVPNKNGSGPDVINWLGSGFDIYNNTFIGYAATNFAPGYHMDGQQHQGGNFTRYWNNFIANCGNYQIYVDLTGASVTNCLIYNNVIIGSAGIIVGVDAGPAPIRYFHNVVIANNVVDCGTNYIVQPYALGNPRQDTSAYFIECKVANNIAIYNGGPSLPFNFIGWTNVNANATNANVTVSTAEAATIFRRYAPSQISNDFHLLGTASSLIGKGTNLYSFFTADKDGNAQPSFGAWDIGAYEYISQGSPIIAIAPTTRSFGSIAVGVTTNQSFTVQNTGAGTLSGNASVPAPFSIVSGSSYSLGAGQSNIVTVRYSPTAVATNNQAVTFTGGNGATAAVNGIATLAALPVISVSPPLQSFGSLAVGATADATFTVQNVGSGTLSGAASVAAPFSVVSGSPYSLGAGQSQSVTARYTPTAPGTNTQAVAFTGGSGATATVSGIATVPAPWVAPITPNATDVDPSTPELQIYAGSVVQYSGSASDPTGYPLTWQWLYSLNGGPEIMVQSGTGTVTAISFNYTAVTAGNSYIWKLRVGNGYSTGESTLGVGVVAPTPVAGGFIFQAGGGDLTAPLVLTNGYLSQSVQTTDPAFGGRVAYSFTVVNAGNYVIRALVNAPNDGNNSFFLNLDGEPLAPMMIWDIPLTTGFEQRMVSWRGNGTDVNSQFLPKIFSLGAGAHQLIVRGREANTQLQSLSILWHPASPAGVRLGP